MKDPADADAWYADQDTWVDELALLRTLVLDAGLTETLKWRSPCYMDRERNIAVIGFMKAHATLGFFKGVFLDDPDSVLVQPGQDRSARYLAYGSVQAIQDDRDRIRAMLEQAVANERAGLKVEPLPDEIDYVDELQQRLAADPVFREAFEGLTPGRRRQYNHHFGGARKAATRAGRIDAYTERILAGKGMRDCICGKSRRYPQCDGSHKDL